MKELVKFWQCLGFGEAAFEFWWRSASASMQSSRKQKERSCTGLQHGPCSEACASFSEHGYGAWAVKQRRAHQFGIARVGSHGPCSSSNAHGSSTRGVSARRVRWFSELHGACCSTRTVSIIWLARVSEGFSTGRVELIFSTGRADWHGSR